MTELLEIEKQPRSELISLVDWVGVTLKTIPIDSVVDDGREVHSRRDIVLDDIYKLLAIPESEFREMPRGLLGYSKQMACGDIRILYAGKADMGYHVQMSGQGCRQYESYWSLGWEAFFERLYAADADFARLDLAIDDIRYNGDEPYFWVSDLDRRNRGGVCRSKWRNSRPMSTVKLSTGESRGHTIYYGSNQSDIMLRIYEKNFEREAAEMELEEDLTAWNRIELQLRNDRAMATVSHILSGIPSGEIIFGLLKNYINYVDRTDDSNKARWPISEFWSEFLGDVEKLRLSSRAPDKTIPAKKNWLDNSVSATQAEVWWALGSPGEDYFVEMMNRGLEKMSEEQWARAEAFRTMYLAEKETAADLKEVRYADYIARQNEHSEELINSLAKEYLDKIKGDASTSPKDLDAF
ncbi:replication initiation factor domain-containing protein [Paenibacillus sp. NPDC058367]|uniref:replication initiation factor domain-containing protein n=1 Tax=Paenibacillus sp. NPDC058367 TaxID=3346460 RepID=UPI0036496606